MKHSIKRQARDLQHGDRVLTLDDTLWGTVEAWHEVREMHHNHREGVVEFELRDGAVLKYKMVCEPEDEFHVVPMQQHLHLVA